MQNEKPMDKLHSAFGFTTPIPDQVIEALPKIGAEGFTLFSYLMYRIYNNKRESGNFTAFPSRATILSETGLSNRKLNKAIGALEDAGFLERKKRFGASVIYTLKPSSSTMDELPFSSPSTEDHQSIHNGSPVHPQRMTNQDKSNQDESNNNKKAVVDSPNSKSKELELSSFLSSKKESKKLLSTYEDKRVYNELAYCREHGKGPGWLIASLEHGWDIQRHSHEPQPIGSMSMEEFEARSAGAEMAT